MAALTRWIFPELGDVAGAAEIALELGAPRFVAELLCRRGFAKCCDAEAFLRPRLRTLSDPFLLPSMEPAVERILAAIDRCERVALYGDYDVDGVTSLALLTRLLRAYGVAPACFLPLRMDEGYGLSAEGARRCVEEHAPQLLIALDCGSSSAAEIAELQRSGVDVLVFDHHEMKSGAPPCVVVNPKLGGDFHYLCTAGIVFKLCHALLKRRAAPGFDLREHLDLVALGTIADLVPLIGENRILALHGMRQLGKTRWTGIDALMRVAGVRAPITPSHVGFQLGPRLNAAGRLSSAEAALELLLTTEPARAQALAAQLDAQNRERQGVEKAILASAEAQLAGLGDPAAQAAVVLGDRGWHPGVLGIVASRISKKHHRPVLVVGFDESGVGKGSGRSIAGLSLVESLGRCGHLLEKYGGHEMAAGVTMREELFADFQKAFLAAARDLLSDEQLTPCVRLDGEVALADLTFDLLEHHEMMQPFGMGNLQPLLCARGVHPAGEMRLLKERHLLFQLRQGSGRQRAIYFNAAELELPRPPWDIAFRVERSEHRGTVSLDMHIQRMRAAE